MKTTTKTKTIIIINFPIDIFHCLLYMYWKLLGTLLHLCYLIGTQSLPDPWQTPRWVHSPSPMWLRGLMSVLLSMTLYSSWSRNVRGSGDGKRSFYNWHLLKPEKKEREVFNQQFLRWLISEEKSQHKSWGDSFHRDKPQLFMRQFISVKNHNQWRDKYRGKNTQ